MLNTGAPSPGVADTGGWDGAGWAPGSGCSFPAAQLHLGAAACPGAARAQHVPPGFRERALPLAAPSRGMSWLQEPQPVPAPELPPALLGSGGDTRTLSSAVRQSWHQQELSLGSANRIQCFGQAEVAPLCNGTGHEALRSIHFSSGLFSSLT